MDIKAAIIQRIAEAEDRRQQLAAEISFVNGVKAGLEELLSALQGEADDAAALDALAAVGEDDHGELRHERREGEQYQPGDEPLERCQELVSAGQERASKAGTVSGEHGSGL